MLLYSVFWIGFVAVCIIDHFTHTPSGKTYHKKSDKNYLSRQVQCFYYETYFFETVFLYRLV